MHGHKRQHWLAIFLVVAAFVPCSSAQSSAQVAGRVSALVPHATRQGKPLQQNDVLFLNDVLNTDKSGRLRVRLEDGSLLSLGGSSQIRVTQHDAAARQTSIELKFGRLRSDVATLTQPGAKFEVRTASAVAGVIGTSYEVVETPQGTYVYCYSGKVSVTSLFGLGTVTLSAGEGVLITSTQLGKPFQFQPGQEVGAGVEAGATSGGLSGLHIVGITLGVVGGAIGGVVAGTGNPGDKNALPTPTPPTQGRCNPQVIKLCNTGGAPPLPIVGSSFRQLQLPSSASASFLAAKQLSTARQFSMPNYWSGAMATHPGAAAFSKPAIGIGSQQSFLQNRPTNNWLATRQFAAPSNRFGASLIPRVLANHPGLARAPFALPLGRTPFSIQIGRTAFAPHLSRTPLGQQMGRTILAPHWTQPAGNLQQPSGGTLVPGPHGPSPQGRR